MPNVHSEIVNQVQIIIHLWLLVKHYTTNIENGTKSKKTDIPPQVLRMESKDRYTTRSIEIGVKRQKTGAYHYKYLEQS